MNLQFIKDFYPNLTRKNGIEKKKETVMIINKKPGIDIFYHFFSLLPNL